MKYKVINMYGITGETSHRKVERALQSASKREGDGWTVIDTIGDRWIADSDGRPVCIPAHAYETFIEF